MSASITPQAPHGSQARTSTTYRVYVRMPNQKVTARTTTTDEAVARLAWGQLLEHLDDFRSMGAIGVAMTKDGDQVDYLKI